MRQKIGNDLRQEKLQAETKCDYKAEKKLIDIFGITEINHEGILKKGQGKDRKFKTFIT